MAMPWSEDANHEAIQATCVSAATRCATRSAGLPAARLWLAQCQVLRVHLVERTQIAWRPRPQQLVMQLADLLFGHRQHGWATWPVSTTFGVCRQHGTCRRKEEEQLHVHVCNKVYTALLQCTRPCLRLGALMCTLWVLVISSMYMHTNFSRRLTARTHV